MNAIDRGRLFRAYPVLRSLPIPLFGSVEAQVAASRIPAGRKLFERGTYAHAQPLLAEGIVRVSKSDRRGRRILLYRLTPGECCVVAATTLLAATTYPATGVAETDLQVFTLPRGLFIEMVLGSEAWRTFVFTAVAQKMSRLMALVGDVAFHQIDHRLALRLLQSPQPIIATHRMLAEELGTRREVVSRILKTFQQAGAIRLARRRIEVLDRGALSIVHGSADAVGASHTRYP